MRIQTDVPELLGNGFFLHALALQLGAILQELGGSLLIVIAKLVEVAKVCLQCLVYFDLHEFFQTLILLNFELNVDLFGDQQLMHSQLLLIQL